MDWVSTSFITRLKPFVEQMQAALSNLLSPGKTVAPAVPVPSNRSVWEHGVAHELEFWRHWFRTQGGRWTPDYQRRLDPEAPLLGLPLSYLGQFQPLGGTVEILDVGAGPLTILGKTAPEHKLHITAVDALGDLYRQLYLEFSISPPVPTQTCHTERLLEKFEIGQFDLVFAQNTLDHHYDPVIAFLQMLQVTKAGGYIITIHLANEGEVEGYEGFHQWNFKVEGGDHILWNRQRQYSLSALIRGQAEIIHLCDEGGDHNNGAAIAVLRKLH